MNVCERLSPDRLCIFLFHGVVEQHHAGVRNYTRKHISRDFFAEVIAQLTQSGTPLSMDDVVRHCQKQTPFPRGSYAITFDDGFENNFSVAAPILERAEVPATFYVTTSFIQSNALSWIDCIEICMESVDRGDLLLPWSADSVSWSTLPEKIAILDEIRREVKTRPEIDVQRFVADVHAQLNREVTLSSQDPLDLKMNWNQLKALSEHTLFTIGGHSHHHEILSHLNDDILQEEISLSVKLLESHLSVPVRHYSYPEGLKHCYNSNVITRLKEHGIQCATTAIDGTNAPSTDLFELTRISVVE